MTYDFFTALLVVYHLIARITISVFDVCTRCKFYDFPTRQR